MVGQRRLFGKKMGVAFLSLYGVKPYDVETVTLTINGIIIIIILEIIYTLTSLISCM
jgi:hypothetical protein